MLHIDPDLYTVIVQDAGAGRVAAVRPDASTVCRGFEPFRGRRKIRLKRSRTWAEPVEVDAHLTPG